MIIADNHFRFYVFTQTKLGVPPLTILENLQNVFGDRAPSRTFVYKWQKEYNSNDSPTSFDDKDRPGRPVTVRSGDNVEKVKSIVEASPKASARGIGEELDLPKSTVHRILTKI